MLAQALIEAGAKNADRKKLCCPFHDDKNPSAGIHQTDAGFWYFHCYVCDINEDVWGIRARVQGRPVGELLKAERPEPPKPKRPVESYPSIDALVETYKRRNPRVAVEEVNAYTDPQTGEADFYTLRLRPQGEDKTFRQVSKGPNGWQWSGLTGKLPLFNRTRINQCERILIVEGEKCVRELTRIGANLAATTSPGGAKSALKADWSPLAGKTCYIWRDNDEPGKAYEADVISALQKLDPAPTIFRVRVEDIGLDPKADVADYLNEESMTNAEKVASVELCLFDAEPINVTSALADKFDRIFSGEFRAIALPQKPVTSNLSKAVMPGCLTTIVGEPGAGKSFLILEDFWRWAHFGERVKLLMLEDDDAFHQNRVLAQMSGYADLLDPDFVIDNQEFASKTLREYRNRLEGFARHLETAKGQMSLDEIAQWVINHAENGVRIIGVDPVTAAKASDKPWIDDQKFLFQVKPVLERTGASLILTTHPRIGQAGKPSLSGIAGGASYPRFSQTVFWLRHFDKDQDGYVWGDYVGKPVKYRRLLQIRKCRNGKGHGRDVAFNLNSQNLCFDEIGELEDARD